MMFGGGAYTSFRDAGVLFCGGPLPCQPKTAGFTYTFGVDVWLTRFVGLEGAYMRPHEVSASGGDAASSFGTTMESDVWTVAGKLGAQAGVVRIYGKGGLNYHQATTRTVQTIDNISQVLEYRTTGWSWLFGGGMEAWMGQNQRLAIFADAGIMRIKGASEGEAAIDDRLKYVAVGVKLRLSR
jgi:hypothetical protein